MKLLQALIGIVVVVVIGVPMAMALLGALAIVLGAFGFALYIVWEIIFSVFTSS